MMIRTPRDLGAAIRDQRKRRRLGQQELASKIGVSRQWVVEVEKGKPRAEVGLVLKALTVLDIELSLAQESIAIVSSEEMEPDIDDIIDSARGKQ